MFKNLREAHDTPTESLRDRNDEILERIYIDRRFKNDTVRVVFSQGKRLEMYTKMTTQQPSPKQPAQRKTKSGK